MKVYDYGEEFENLWKSINKDSRETRKALGYKVFLKMKSSCDDLEEQAKEKNKWIKELLDKAECKKCGTTEFLCGHNRRA